MNLRLWGGKSEQELPLTLQNTKKNTSLFGVVDVHCAGAFLRDMRFGVLVEVL